MAWATNDDLLLGDTQFDSGDWDRYLRDAETEILIHLAQYYELPIPDNDQLPERIFMLLRQIQSRLASGRLILAYALSQGQADESLNAYGRYLIDDALGDLVELGSQIPIPGATAAINPDATSVDNDLRPSITQIESASPVEAFANYTSNQSVDPWEPYVK